MNIGRLRLSSHYGINVRGLTQRPYDTSLSDFHRVSAFPDLGECLCNRIVAVELEGIITWEHDEQSIVHAVTDICCFIEQCQFL